MTDQKGFIAAKYCNLTFHVRGAYPGETFNPEYGVVTADGHWYDSDGKTELDSVYIDGSWQSFSALDARLLFADADGVGYESDGKFVITRLDTGGLEDDGFRVEAA